MGRAKTLLAGGIVAIATGAAAEALNIEPGLWSIAYTYSVGPGKPQTTTSDTCITADDLTAFVDSSEDEDCQRTMSSETATHWSGVEHCTSDKGAQDRDIEINAADPRSMNGAMHGKTGEGADAGGMHLTFTGNWIATECGDAD